MSAIVERVFGEGAKKGLLLGGEEFVRKMAFAGEWNYLRVIMSVAITPNGTSNITGTRLVVSLINNTIQGRTYNSTNTTNCLGCMINHTNESTGQTLTYVANSGNPYYNQVTGRGAYFTRVGNTTTQASFITVGGQTAIPTTGGTVQRRGIIAVDFLRNTTMGSGTANWQQQVTAIQTAAGMAVDSGQKEIIYMLQYAPGVATDPTVASAFVATPLVDAAANPNEAANGVLDTVSIFWNQSAFPLEIYELALFRIA